MTQQTGQTATPTSTIPTRIGLEDFIEAVASGVSRAMQAEDDVSGYLPIPPSAGPIIIGLVLPPRDRFKPDPGPIMPVPPVARKTE